VASAEAVIVGSGPNGLAAALVLAQAGIAVQLIEGTDELGGGCRSADFDTPGYRYDVCSAVLPLAVASPVFASLDLAGLGVEFAQPKIPVAHALGGDRAVVIQRSLEATVENLGRDGASYRALLEPLLEHADGVVDLALAPLRSVPSDWRAALAFGPRGLLPLTVLARRFRTDAGRGLLAGLAAHSGQPLDAPVTAGFALILALLAHVVGWPVVRGGTGALVDGIERELRSLGVEIETGRTVASLDELGRPRVVLLDCAAQSVVALASGQLSPSAARRYAGVRSGPGVCKVDFALSGPVPWSASACRDAATVHLGGTLEEIAAGERAVVRGRHPDTPFVLAVQPTVADPSRAPGGGATLWAYCHVPNGSDIDVSAQIEAQIERFAPGFGDLVIERRVRTAAQYAEYNPNYVGGDITGGAQTLRQTLFRPTVAWNPYRTPIDSVYLCSSATPPGGGVHGMCGAHAARAVLRERFGRDLPALAMRARL
jgi:phytoene dehydrogenase-like protein